MKQRNLGRSDLLVSLVGLGCNNFGSRIGLEDSRSVIHRALDLGITLLDTSDVYGDPRGTCEQIIGEVLGCRRNDVVLATKFWLPPDDAKQLRGPARRKHIMTALDNSLRRLKTDWIDLYQEHRPDPLAPPEETLRAFDDLIRQGKVRCIGCSNLPAWRVADAVWVARDAGLNSFVSCEDEYSLLVRGPERDLIPALQYFGLGLLPYFPLAGGLLTGKYRRNGPLPEGARLTMMQNYRDRYMIDTNLSIVERLTEFCAKRGHSLLELALSWLSARSPVASIIAGATKPEQVEMNVRAIDWNLSVDDLSTIDELTLGSARAI